MAGQKNQFRLHFSEVCFFSRCFQWLLYSHKWLTLTFSTKINHLKWIELWQINALQHKCKVKANSRYCQLASCRDITVELFGFAGNISTLPYDLLQMVQGILSAAATFSCPSFSLSILVSQLIWLYFPAHVFAEEHSPLFCTSWCPWCCIIICGWFENMTVIWLGFLLRHLWHFGC